MSGRPEAEGVPPEVASWPSVPAGFGDKTDLGPLCWVTLERSFMLSWSRANARAGVLALPPARSVALDSLLTSLCLCFRICELPHLARKAVGRSRSDVLMVSTPLAQCLQNKLPPSADRRESSGPGQKQTTVPRRVGHWPWKPVVLIIIPFIPGALGPSSPERGCVDCFPGWPPGLGGTTP